jgi:hypothetical protein
VLIPERQCAPVSAGPKSGWRKRAAGGPSQPIDPRTVSEEFAAARQIRGSALLYRPSLLCGSRIRAGRRHDHGYCHRSCRAGLPAFWSTSCGPVPTGNARTKGIAGGGVTGEVAEDFPRRRTWPAISSARRRPRGIILSEPIPPAPPSSPMRSSIPLPRERIIRLVWIAGHNGANRAKVLPSYADLREFRRTKGRYGRQEKRPDRRRFGERYKST